MTAEDIFTLAVGFGVVALFIYAAIQWGRS